MAALQLSILRNFFGDFDARMNELTGASERWETAKIWLLDNFQTLLIISSAVIFPGLLFVVLSDHWDIEFPQPVGCKRVGRDKSKSPASASKGQGAQIFPIKNCKPLELEGDEYLPTDTRYDDQFSFAQLVASATEKQRDRSGENENAWHLITRRDFPRLEAVDVQLWVPDETNRQYNVEREAVKNGGCLLVSFPFVVDSSLSLRYLEYLYNSAKAKYIRRSWSAQPVVVFEVPFLPTAERMQRKAYGPTQDTVQCKDDPEAINFGAEIAPDVLAKLRSYLGANNPLTLFRVDTDHYHDKSRKASKRESTGHQSMVSKALELCSSHVLNDVQRLRSSKASSG